jgi:hypothetical protein
MKKTTLAIYFTKVVSLLPPPEFAIKNEAARQLSVIEQGLKDF